MLIKLILIIKCSLFLSLNIYAAEIPELKQNNEPLKVEFKTTLGSFTIELFADKAPETVKNFLKYVNDGFYENTLFHRVVPDFVIQSGGFNSKMKLKKVNPPIINESLNGLKNVKGSVSMARKREPDSATSQFFINLGDNEALDQRGSQFGYTVFAKIVDGFDTIDKVAQLETHTFRQFKDVPTQEVFIVSAKQTGYFKPTLNDAEAKYLKGKHYYELENKVTKTSEKKVEVKEIFSYACPHCYSFESHIKTWKKNLPATVEFKQEPAVWNGLMSLYAHAFFTANEQKTFDKLHDNLFAEVVIEGTPLLSEAMFATFFAEHGVNDETFSALFDSKKVLDKVKRAQVLTQVYKIKDIPAMIVNNKYRVSLESAGTKEEMLKIVNHLIQQELKL